MFLALAHTSAAARRVVNGARELAEPTAGALIQGSDTDSGWIFCSVTLIGCDIAISAGHCFLSPSDKNYVFFQHAGFYEIESATMHPDLISLVSGSGEVDYYETLRQQDISIIKLSQPVSGIRPIPMVSSEVPAAPPLSVGTPPVGTVGRVVGFGRDPMDPYDISTFSTSSGIKRSGSMTLSECSDPLDPYDALCWEPQWTEADPPAPGESVTSCTVDSGGPMYIVENGVRVVAGTTVGAYIPLQDPAPANYCSPPAQPFDANLARHRDWIRQYVADVGGIDLDITRCADMPQVAPAATVQSCDGSHWTSQVRTRICGFEDELDSLGAELPTQQTHEFQIPLGTRQLRVAMNGLSRDNGSIDADIYVRQGLPATTADYDCASTGTGNLAYCEFDAPADGAWHILVDQKAGKGPYQIAVTLYADPMEVPAMGTPGWSLLVGLVTLGALAGTRRKSLERTQAS